jgi:hypothetical protein
MEKKQVSGESNDNKQEEREQRKLTKGTLQETKPATSRYVSVVVRLPTCESASTGRIANWAGSHHSTELHGTGVLKNVHRSVTRKWKGYSCRL